MTAGRDGTQPNGELAQNLSKLSWRVLRLPCCKHAASAAATGGSVYRDLWHGIADPELLLFRILDLLDSRPAKQWPKAQARLRFVVEYAPDPQKVMEGVRKLFTRKEEDKS